MKSQAARVRARLGPVVPYLAFFVILLWISLPAGLDSPVSAVNIAPTLPAAQAAETFGGSDAGSLLRAALSLQEAGTITPEFRWIYNLWPPGMVVVDRVLVELELVTGLSVISLMIVANCLAWSALLGTVFTMVRRRAGTGVALVFGAGALLYSGITQWGTDGGLFYADSFGAISFAFCLLALVMVPGASTVRRKIAWAALAGVALASAAYFRASFEIIADGTFVVALAIFLLALIGRRLRRWPRFSPAAIQATWPVLVAGIATQLVLLPWRVYAAIRQHPGDLRWSTVSDLASSARWLPESVLRERGIFFGIDGHSNWACLSDPVQCEYIYKIELATGNPYSGLAFGGDEFDAMTLQSFLTHPLQYITERLSALWLGFTANTGGGVLNVALPESLLLAALFIAILVYMFRRGGFAKPAYLFFLVAVGGQVATLALMHMESRYFLGIELGVLVLGALTIAEWIGKRDAAPPSQSMKTATGPRMRPLRFIAGRGRV